MELNAVDDGAAVEDVVVVEDIVGDADADVVDVVVVLPPPVPRLTHVAPKSPVFLKVSAAPPPIKTSNLVFWL